MSETLPATTDTTEVKQIARSLLFEGEPSVVFEDAARKYNDGKLHEMDYVGLKKLALAPGIGSQFSIVDAVDDIHVPLLVSFARQLIEEYGCKMPSEIAVAEVTATSYVHYVVASKRMSRNVGDSKYDKQVTLAHRRFLSALGALRQMMRPPVSVKIVAENAFIAQNQVNQAQNPHDAK
ncbi:MAG TPA: hypothetical protein VG102_03490 [Candidatus Paceibacterota bacterium]|jgi:hypothetical protein|nr:hypothetical protein [Candidatus Paceibacterota bacterium]